MCPNSLDFARAPITEKTPFIRVLETTSAGYAHHLIPLVDAGWVAPAARKNRPTVTPTLSPTLILPRRRFHPIVLQSRIFSKGNYVRSAKAPPRPRPLFSKTENERTLRKIGKGKSSQTRRFGSRTLTTLADPRSGRG